MIVCIGEIVWDIFKDRQALGGAPVNVAYHLHSLGIETSIITRIGSDELGRHTRAHIEILGLSCAGIQQDSEFPTGTVKVSVDENNEPHFHIVAPAAWDKIDSSQAMQTTGDKPFGLIFGTLAQRDPVSRSAIRALWEKADRRFYDVNLRPPFTTRELVMESLQAAEVVKVNAAELAQIFSWVGITPANRGRKATALAAQDLRKHSGLELVVVTEGEKGAWLVCSDGFFEHPGFPVDIVDTVGAGDAFFATLLAGYLASTPWQKCLTEANKRGAYVASKPGATPPFPAT